eukprot:1694139-Prymnesium_polylepis.1
MRRQHRGAAAPRVVAEHVERTAHTHGHRAVHRAVRITARHRRHPSAQEVCKAARHLLRRLIVLQPTRHLLVGALALLLLQPPRQPS